MLWNPLLGIAKPLGGIKKTIIETNKMIKTKHKYINENIVKRDDTSLILGTIHPHQTNDFLIDFFYGNTNSIWSILAELFPKYNFDSKENIINTLQLNNIWISDLILECDRENEKVTQDKELKNIKLNVDQIREGIENSKIKTIYFTSGFITVPLKSKKVL